MGTQNVILPVSMLAKYKTTVQLIALGICHGRADGAGNLADLGRRPLARRASDRVDRLDLLARRLEDHDGAAAMKVLYFAWLRERLNRGEEEVFPAAEVATVADLLDWLGARDEAAALAFADRKAIRAAIDEEIVDLDTPACRRQDRRAVPADDRRLTPLFVRLQSEPFDPGAETNAFLDGRDEAGAFVTFVGTVRSTPGEAGREPDPRALSSAGAKADHPLRQDAMARFDLLDIGVIHRFGTLLPGEVIVMVLALSAHRQAAFDGANYVMDWLKTDAPFWKRETGPDGSDWVGGQGRGRDGQEQMAPSDLTPTPPAAAPGPTAAIDHPSSRRTPGAVPSSRSVPSCSGVPTKTRMHSDAPDLLRRWSGIMVAAEMPGHCRSSRHRRNWRT